MQTAADRAAPVSHAKVCCERYQGISTPIAMKDMKDLLKAKPTSHHNCLRRMKEFP
jgi:hypothetical protein